MTSLAELKDGESGKITYVKPGANWDVHQLVAMGLQPGVSVTVRQMSPAFCIAFEHTELAMDREIARHIFVWRTFPSNSG